MTTGLLALGLLMFAVQARSAEIAGSVTDTQNHPVTSAHVSVKDQAGNVVGKADADTNGHYSIAGIATGEYGISLALPGTKYQGQTIETGVPPEGLCLYWMVSIVWPWYLVPGKASEMPYSPVAIPAIE